MVARTTCPRKDEGVQPPPGASEKGRDDPAGRKMKGLRHSLDLWPLANAPSRSIEEKAGLRG